MGIRLFFVIASKANNSNFLLHPENSECVCGPSQVKPKVGRLIIKWIRKHERNSPVSMVFIQKNILRCRNDARDENLMKLQCKAPHITMIQQNNYFSTKRHEMLNSEHYWFCCHFLHIGLLVFFYQHVQKDKK